MNLQDGSSVVADLTTIGRKTGERRTVALRFTYYQGCFYASSSKVEGKHWCQNMLKNPAVELNAQGERLSCTATQLTGDKLRRRILALRDSPPRMERVVFEIKPISLLRQGNRRSNSSNRSSRSNRCGESDFSTSSLLPSVPASSFRGSPLLFAFPHTSVFPFAFLPGLPSVLPDFAPPNLSCLRTSK